MRSGGKLGSGSSFSTTHNDLIVSTADTKGSGGNLTCNEETGWHEGFFYIGTLAIAGTRQGSAANLFSPSGVSNRCGRLNCACIA